MTNKDRALSARDVLRWQREKSEPGSGTAPLESEDIIELLVNVRHYCRWYGHHFESLDREAQQQFEDQSPKIIREEERENEDVREV